MSKDVRMRGFQSRSTVDEVNAVIDERVGPLGTERLPFNLALGRILAEDIRAIANVPPHRKSAMDGYAVRAADTPGKLEVVGELMAADRFDGTVGAKQAVRIMTGAKVPDGADAVVMVEKTTLEGRTVDVQADLREGNHVLAIGEDLTEGAVVLADGRRLRPQDVAMLVSVGALEVSVRRRPRVRLIPTGTELVRVGAPNPEKKVVESNSFMLQALAERDGAEVILHPIVLDDKEALRAAMVEPGADLIVMTGGSSVGAEDLGPVVAREIGELPVHGVHMKPGSPTGVGFIGGTPIVLSPGYPVAAMVAWDMFARRIVQRLAGATVRLPYPSIRAKLAAPHKKPEGRTELQRATVEHTPEGPVATVIRGGAALLSTATRAAGFIVMPNGVAQLDAGAEVDVHLYDRG